jgi:hypothetical protein
VVHSTLTLWTRFAPKRSIPILHTLWTRCPPPICPKIASEFQLLKPLLSGREMTYLILGWWWSCHGEVNRTHFSVCRHSIRQLKHLTISSLFVVGHISLYLHFQKRIRNITATTYQHKRTTVLLQYPQISNQVPQTTLPLQHTANPCRLSSTWCSIHKPPQTLFIQGFLLTFPAFSPLLQRVKKVYGGNRVILLMFPAM